MTEALNEAKKSIKLGNAPFGAVIVSPVGKIVSRGHDTVRTSRDPTAHAELSAIRKLCKRTKRRTYRDYSCYSTSEPCLMCLAACLKARLNKFYYGAPMEKTASLYIPAKDIIKKFKKFKVQLKGKILEKECLEQRDK